MQPLRWPSFNKPKFVAVTAIAFGVFAGAATLLLSGVDDSDKPEGVVIVLVVAAGSLVVGASPYFYELATTAWWRMTGYGRAHNLFTDSDKRMRRATEHLRRLNTDLPISGIRERDGTVHVVFQFGAAAGLGQGSIVHIVAEPGAEILGTVRIADVTDDWSLGEPINRANADFWEGLEDRMKHDFSPPENVVGRVFRVTESLVRDVLDLLAESEDAGGD